MSEADTSGTAQDTSPGRRGWIRDPLAGLVDGVVALPDGLATAALIGVNPVAGLYAAAIGPAVGGMLTSSRLMIVATTSASAVMAAEALAAFSGEARTSALMLLVLLSGGFLVLFGLLQAGRLVRFVSHAVMTGFMLGVAVMLILSQLPTLIGYSPQPPAEVGTLLSRLLHMGRIAPHTAIIGLSTLALLLILRRTRLSLWSPLLALALPTLSMTALGWSDVPTVASGSAIPRGFPLPRLPALDSLTLDLVGSAFAIAVVVAIQGAGVSQGLAVAHGRRANVSRDMMAQGVANCASSLMSGIGVGGSVSQTALNVSLGAVTRWAGISAGIWLLVFILLIPNLVGLVPTSGLAALMVSAGASAINWREALSIWRVGGGARLAIVATFSACLALSIPVAVGIGVLVTIVYFVSSSATDVSMRMVVQRPDGQAEEQPPPAALTSHQILVLDVWGSLFFAGARTLQENLPDPAGAEEPAVILRMRGHSAVDATLIEVLDDYAHRLSKQGGTLYLSGVSDGLAEQFRRSGKLLPSSNVHIVPVQPIIGAATRTALAEARRWYDDHDNELNA